ncbi:hypothetical protein BDR22DRAFT_846384 [Usnea florida]
MVMFMFMFMFMMVSRGGRYVGYGTGSAIYIHSPLLATYFVPVAFFPLFPLPSFLSFFFPSNPSTFPTSLFLTSHFPLPPTSHFPVLPLPPFLPSIQTFLFFKGR